MTKPKIVILGAGYAGLITATQLQKKLHTSEVSITLVNKNAEHYESTWLHESATGSLTDDQVQYPVSAVINDSKVDFIEDTVEKIDSEMKQVILTNQTLSYDYLIVSLGFETETFGIPGLKKHMLSMSNVQTANQIRHKIEEEFAHFDDNKEEEVTIVVGGAGFTGIEFLGELVNNLPKLCSSYHVDPKKVKVLCIEASPNVLPGFDPELVEYAVDYLEKKGVEFKLSTTIKEATEKEVYVEKNGETEKINAQIMIWAAGVRGSRVIDQSFTNSNRGKIKVDEYLRLPNSENVFIIGDCSLIINEETDRPYPPTAQIAIQQGELCAKNLLSILRGQELKPFIFHNKGTVCSLGEHNAIGLVFGKKIKGYPASLMKKVIDNRSLFLIGGFSLLFKKGKFKFF